MITLLKQINGYSENYTTLFLVSCCIRRTNSLALSSIFCHILIPLWQGSPELLSHTVVADRVLFPSDSRSSKSSSSSSDESKLPAKLVNWFLVVSWSIGRPVLFPESISGSTLFSSFCKFWRSSPGMVARYNILQRCRNSLDKRPDVFAHCMYACSISLLIWSEYVAKYSSISFLSSTPLLGLVLLSCEVSLETEWAAAAEILALTEGE